MDSGRGVHSAGIDGPPSKPIRYPRGLFAETRQYERPRRDRSIQVPSTSRAVQLASRSSPKVFALRLPQSADSSPRLEMAVPTYCEPRGSGSTRSVIVKGSNPPALCPRAAISVIAVRSLSASRTLYPSRLSSVHANIRDADEISKVGLSADQVSAGTANSSASACG